MAPGQGDPAPMASCVKTGSTWRTGDMDEVLAQLQDSGSIHFQKSLARAKNRKFGQCVQLALPVWFVQEHSAKFEEWVILRNQSSSKPSRVRMSVLRKPRGSAEVKFAGGWKVFAAENRLKEGDWLIFVLKVYATSEFQVYIFRGTRRSSSNSQTPARKWTKNNGGTKFSEQAAQKSDGCRHERSGSEGNVRKTGDPLIRKQAVQEGLQNLGDRSSDSQYDGQAPPSVHHPDQQCRMGFTSHGVEQKSGAVYSEVVTGSERKGLASQQCTNSLPAFRKRLIAYDNSIGRFEVPASFAKTHRMELQGDVELQGIYEESPAQMVTCDWKRHGEYWRLYFKAGWSSFLEENSLLAGQELHFTLTAASFFVLRKV